MTKFKEKIMNMLDNAPTVLEKITFPSGKMVFLLSNEDIWIWVNGIGFYSVYASAHQPPKCVKEAYIASHISKVL